MLPLVQCLLPGLLCVVGTRSEAVLQRSRNSVSVGFLCLLGGFLHHENPSSNIQSCDFSLAANLLTCIHGLFEPLQGILAANLEDLAGLVFLLNN